jgi:ATP-dependent helicase/nuclease subunit A
VAGALTPDALLAGYIDLVVAMPAMLVVIDFKTDAPPRGALHAAYPGYVAQVAAYARLLGAAAVGEGRTLRSALLFTADGSLHWT